MCGRFTHQFTWAQLHRLLRLIGQERPIPPRYNVAPTQTAPVVTLGNSGGRELVDMHWGLIPSWAKDKSMAARAINARAETVATLPAFRAAFKSGRCVVPISAFYEWRQTLGSKAKQPFLIGSSDGEPLLLAGLCERWQDKIAGTTIDSFTIITTTPNELIAELHDRMPVILTPEECDRWLDPDAQPDELQSLLRPYPSELMMRHPVSPRVNSPRVDSPELVNRVEESAPGLF
jgi:putative SOS response-associated peptidase YedK